MSARFDLDFVAFRCKHPKCGEVFEKSLGDLAGVDEVICPRCGTAVRVGEENRLPEARTSEEGADTDKTTR